MCACVTIFTLFELSQIFTDINLLIVKEKPNFCFNVNGISAKMFRQYEFSFASLDIMATGQSDSLDNVFDKYSPSGLSTNSTNTSLNDFIDAEADRVLGNNFLQIKL